MPVASCCCCCRRAGGSNVTRLVQKKLSYDAFLLHSCYIPVTMCIGIHPIAAAVAAAATVVVAVVSHPVLPLHRVIIISEQSFTITVQTRWPTGNHRHWHEECLERQQITLS